MDFEIPNPSRHISVYSSIATVDISKIISARAPGSFQALCSEKIRRTANIIPLHKSGRKNAKHYTVKHAKRSLIGPICARSIGSVGASQ